MTRYLEIKPGSISEVSIRLRDDYQALFKAELEKAGKGLAQMTDAEKKAFFNKIDKMHNAKNEAMNGQNKPDDSKTTLVVKPGAPKGQESVIRIPKEKLADYKSKGYIEAESYIPEAKKIDELTAGQKKLPPALQKAIKAKEKKEAVDNPYAIGMAAAMKATGDTPPLKKSTIVKAHKIADKVKKEEVEINEATPLQTGISMMKTLAAAAGIKPATSNNGYQAIYDYKNGEGTFKGQGKKSYEQVKNWIYKNGYEVQVSYLKQILGEEVEINEAEGSSGGGMDALRAIKAKRQRLEQELQNLNKDDANYTEKAANLKKQIEGQKEIMARKQREVFDNYDPTLDEGFYKDVDVRKGDLKLAKDKRQALKDKYNAIMAGQAQGDEGSIEDQIQKLDMSIKKQEQELIDKMKMMKKEAVDPERITNLQQRIQKMTADMGKIDMAKPENKTKQAIYKSDIQTAQLRLKDLIQKKTNELNKQVKETKMGYKSFRQSLKKEQDKKDPKKTMTGQPVDTINTEPKLEIK